MIPRGVLQLLLVILAVAIVTASVLLGFHVLLVQLQDAAGARLLWGFGVASLTVGLIALVLLVGALTVTVLEWDRERERDEESGS